jgi:hypothetical protein
MSYTDVVSRVSQIQAQIASLQTAFTPSAAGAATQSATGTAAAGSSGSFASALAQAQQTTGAAGDVSAAGLPATGLSTTGVSTTGVSTTGVSTTGVTGTSGASLPAGAQSQLTSGQQQFAARLAANTGLDPSVISAWLLAEESSGAAQSRQAANNNDWLNIGYTDSGTFGSSDSVWGDPTTAADATAGWLKGQNTIPGYGTASSGVQAILQTAGQPPASQIAALQQSGWASSGYPDLPSLYQQVAG